MSILKRIVARLEKADAILKVADIEKAVDTKKLDIWLAPNGRNSKQREYWCGELKLGEDYGPAVTVSVSGYLSFSIQDEDLRSWYKKVRFDKTSEDLNKKLAEGLKAMRALKTEAELDRWADKSSRVN